jgi:hypothetical protein
MRVYFFVKKYKVIILYKLKNIKYVIITLGVIFMDLIIILVLIILTIIFFRRFSNVVYIICIIDMFLRIISKIEVLLGIKEISNLVNRYLPDSLLAVINSYSSGIINTILVWLYVGIYVIFLYYVVCTFFRKKK